MTTGILGKNHICLATHLQRSRAKVALLDASSSRSFAIPELIPSPCESRDT